MRDEVKLPNNENNNNDTMVLHRNQYIQPPNYLATMVSKMVSIGKDGVKEPSLSSARILNVITANQAGVINVIIDANLKQNSKLFVHYI